MKGVGEFWMKNKPRSMHDIVYLMLSAILVAVVLIIIVFSPLTDYLQSKFSKDWLEFVVQALIYLFILLHAVFKAPLPVANRWRLLIFQVMYYIVTVGAAFLLFRFGVVPMPKGMLSYVFPIVGLTIISVFSLRYLTEHIVFFQKWQKK